jgi:HlyD family secretion protein
LKVPLTAMFRDGAEWAVFVEENGRARRRSIEPGHNNGIEAEIAGGLSAGERVVLHPSDRIVDGVRLTER